LRLAEKAGRFLFVKSRNDIFRPEKQGMKNFSIKNKKLKYLRNSLRIKFRVESENQEERAERCRKI